MNRPRNQAEQELKARARIYVANIPQPGMTRKEVVSVFHKYGEIDSKLSINNLKLYVQYYCMCYYFDIIMPIRTFDR